MPPAIAIREVAVRLRVDVLRRTIDVASTAEFDFCRRATLAAASAFRAAAAQAASAGRPVFSALDQLALWSAQPEGRALLALAILANPRGADEFLTGLGLSGRSHGR
jgi:hypothetical protein